MTVQLVNNGTEPFAVRFGGCKWVVPPPEGGTWRQVAQVINIKDPLTGIETGEQRVNGCKWVRISANPVGVNFVDIPDDARGVLPDLIYKMEQAKVEIVADSLRRKSAALAVMDSELDARQKQIDEADKLLTEKRKLLFAADVEEVTGPKRRGRKSA